MKPGDHLVVSRWGYDHHGLYAGNNQVIHYTGPFLRIPAKLNSHSGQREHPDP